MNIKDLADKYNLSKSDFWEMKFGGKSNWIITHDAVEKIADIEKIDFHLPQVFRDTNSNVAMMGEATKGEKRVWSTGESSSFNNKNPYNWAMAEKRLKDRLTLKIINAYEYGIYSDVEADDFKKAK
tara:strand:+ start:2489 stop:2866 length:378 start_codon:yes stop_codon:yes gene_type:complete